MPGASAKKSVAVSDNLLARKSVIEVAVEEVLLALTALVTGLPAESHFGGIALH